MLPRTAGKPSQDDFESASAPSRDRRSAANPKKGNEVGELVKINIGGGGGTVVRAETIIYGGGGGGGGGRRLHVPFRKAGHDGLRWEGGKLAEKLLGRAGERVFCF